MELFVLEYPELKLVGLRIFLYVHIDNRQL